MLTTLHMDDNLLDLIEAIQADFLAHGRTIAARDIIEGGLVSLMRANRIDDIVGVHDFTTNLLAPPLKARRFSIEFKNRNLVQRLKELSATTKRPVTVIVYTLISFMLCEKYERYIPKHKDFSRLQA